jgi:ankyrin repeat protein
VAAALLERGASLLAQDSKGRHALHVAACSGSTGMMKVLLGSGASVDQGDANGWTPLHWASSSGKQEAASWLLAAGAGVGAVDSQGCTPLHTACSKGRVAVLRVLVAAGALLDARDGQGRTPLLAACDAGQAAVVEELLGGGAVDAPTHAGDTALQLACRAGHGEAVGLLLAAGADPHAMRGGMTPLHEALESNSISCLEVLLAAGADADQQYGAGAVTATGSSLQGAMPLQRALQLNHRAAVPLLVTPANLQRMSGLLAPQVGQGQHQQQQQAQAGSTGVAPPRLIGAVAVSLYEVLQDGSKGANTARVQHQAMSAVGAVLQSFGVGTATTLVQQVLVMCSKSTNANDDKDKTNNVANSSRCAMQLLGAVHTGWLAGVGPQLKQLRVSNRLERLVTKPLLHHHHHQQQQQQQGEGAAALDELQLVEGGTDTAHGLWARAEAAAAAGQWSQVVELMHTAAALHPACAHSSLYELAGRHSGRHLAGVARLCGALLAAWWCAQQQQQQQSQAFKDMVRAVVAAVEVAWQQRCLVRRGADA